MKCSVFYKTTSKLKHCSKSWTTPDMAPPGGLRVGPMPDLTQWTRRHSLNQDHSPLSECVTHGSRPTYWLLLPRDAMLARYVVVVCLSVCLSVCHKPVLYRNDWTNRAGLGHGQWRSHGWAQIFLHKLEEIFAVAPDPTAYSHYPVTRIKFAGATDSIHLILNAMIRHNSTFIYR